jgi:hypothetical protein
MYDLLEMSVDTSFENYSIFNEPWRLNRLGATGLGRTQIFVELIGIEPMTSGLQSQRSPN